MKRVLTTIGIFLTLVLVGCGSPAKQNGGQQAGPTELVGTWQITATQPGTGSNVFNTTLVPDIGASVGCPETVCFISTTATEISGSFIYPQVEVGVATSVDPIPANGTAQVYFYEYDPIGNFAEFIGNGTATGSQITGTWSCDTSLSPVCQGMSGTFTAIKQ
jgi:hypothetical protein